MSNPSLPPAPVAPPMGAASSSPPIRRRARDPDDDDAAALEKGELRVPVPVVRGGHESSDFDTEDDDDDKRRYEFQPRVVEHDDDPASEAVRRPLQPSPRLRASLNALDILLGAGAGAGGALPSPTPSAAGEDCESDATLSDDDYRDRPGASSAATTAAADAVDRGSAATGKRGCKARGNIRARVVFSDSDSDESGLNTVSAGDGDIQRAAGTTTTSIIIPQAAPADLHHHRHQQPPPLLPKQEAHQPPRAPQPPRRKRERPTEYTCKVCGKSYSTNQALGGHAAGHKNKQREAEAMAAAMAAAAAGGGGGGASLDAAFLPLHRGGKANKPHECRHCGKVFGTGVALGGHMRVHYTGPPIVPARKNKKRCLAPPPTTQAAAPPVGLSLGLSIKAEENVAVPAPTAVAAVGLSLGLSIKAEEELPSTPPPAAPPAGGAVGVVRLFGIDISPHAQQAPLEQR